MARAYGQLDAGRLEVGLELIARAAGADRATQVQVRRTVAGMLGITDEHLRRILRDGRGPGRRRGAPPMPPELRPLLYRHRGCVEKAARQYQQLTGSERPSTRTLRRSACAEISPMELAQMRHGDAAAREQLIYMPLHYRFREAAKADSKILTRWFEHPITGEPSLAWITDAMECATHAVIGYSLLPGADSVHSAHPTEASVFLCVRHGLDPSSEPVGFGGEIEWWQTDQGPEKTSDGLTVALGSLGVKRRVTHGYHPHENGRIEAFHKIFEEEFCAPNGFYARSPQALDGMPYLPAGPLPTFAEFEAEVADFIRFYNHERVHGQLGCTPAEAWRRAEAGA